MKFITQSAKFGFRLEQLMELAGLSCAQAIFDYCSKKIGRDKDANILFCCGPGNNGGDGLVAARHLRHFGMIPQILYPKKGKTDLFDDLITQCKSIDIKIFDELPQEEFGRFDLIVDALFGFGFSGEPREPFKYILNNIQGSSVDVFSIDVPSGWAVDSEIQPNGGTSALKPQALISLTAPKLCAKGFHGTHYIGGRFLPNSLKKEFGIETAYRGDLQFYSIDVNNI